MHDPMSQIWNIKNPFSKSVGGYKSPLLTVWHIDPCRDGSDDSCGRFMRAKHGDKKVLERIIRRFKGEYDAICQ